MFPGMATTTATGRRPSSGLLALTRLYRRNRRPIVLGAAPLLFLAALLLSACSSGPVAAQDLLLGHQDFDGGAVLESGRESTETADGSPAVQVELTGPGFKILQSLVVFESRQAARTTLAGIKQDQAALGIPGGTREGFDDLSGIKPGSLAGEDASTLFFVEGRALVSLTVAGLDQENQIWEFAETARDKASRQ